MADEFEGPSSGDFFKPKEHNGELLLVQPASVEKDVKTEFGVDDATRATIVVLDGPNAGTEFPDGLIFGALRKSVGHIGKWHLGRLGQGQAKPGKSAPWVLQEPTDADKDVARRYLAQSQAAPF